MLFGGIAFLLASLLEDVSLRSDLTPYTNPLIILMSFLFGAVSILIFEVILQRARSKALGLTICMALIPLIAAAVFAGGHIGNCVRIFILIFAWVGIYIALKRAWAHREGPG
jgi:hypothetical protein